MTVHHLDFRWVLTTWVLRWGFDRLDFKKRIIIGGTRPVLPFTWILRVGFDCLDFRAVFFSFWILERFLTV